MPDSSRTQAINENIALTRTQIAREARAARAESRAARAIEFAERERRSIRASELAAKINELEDALRILRPLQIDLIQDQIKANLDANSYYDSYEKELGYNPEPVITANLQESHLGTAFKNQGQKIARNYANNAPSDVRKRTAKRYSKLWNRLNWRRKQANAEFSRMKESAKEQYEQSLAKYHRLTSLLSVTNETIKESEDALATLRIEATALNVGGLGKRIMRPRRQKKGGKWSLKYKRSINCKNPRGFSQKQYCKYGKKYKND